MDNQKRIELITRRPTQEFLTLDDLGAAIETGVELNHYIGFEISGLLHLGIASCGFKIADLQEAGVNTSLFLADFHSVINDKLGGDLEFIQRTAKEYFVEALKSSIKIAGGKPEKTKVVLASEIYDNDYWAMVIKIAKQVNLARTSRSISIMGRQESTSVPTAWLLYPMMQAADIFFQSINIAHAGMDQRKVHVIARDVGQKLAGYKPMALHNHLLLGLQKPAVWPIPTTKKEQLEVFKMSKSVEGSAIYIHDSPDKIQAGIKHAFCPEETENNPVLDWTKNIVFMPRFAKRLPFVIERPEKYGGTKEFWKFSDVLEEFKNKKLHPSDLKSGLASYLIDLLKPARKQFSKKQEMIEQINAARSR